MLASYVRRDLLRNPRRTLAALAGVTLGVGLFSGVLFFVDGSGASMTRRALAPLAIDMQRVVASPLGGGLALTERVSPAGRLAAGQPVKVTLTVANRGAVAANEVVLNDAAPAPLAYARATTRLGGRRLDDVAGASPLSQGAAMTGLNVGTVRPRRSLVITYLARATASVAPGALRLQGRISSRESVVPTPANAPAPLTLEQLAAAVRQIPGVAATDTLAFVDLPPGSLSSSGGAIRDTVRVFGFDGRYPQRYPSIRIVGGSLRPGAGV
ncbi:MAG: hypothetical protein QOH17_3992, partial [Pseudonocardiales bacterium]|nr:hypothetical protein [Pseudonocardiales bacterium]